MSGPRRPPLGWLPRGPRRIREDIDDELRFHLEERATELEQQGWSPGEARTEARRRFGDLEETRIACYRSDLRRERHDARRDYLSEILGDLRHGARQLRSSPGFTAAAVATLAFGIGATTAIWSAADHVLLRPLPYREAGRVMTLWQTDAGSGAAKVEVSPWHFLEWVERSSSFEHLAVADPSGFDLTEQRPPEAVPAWRVSSGFLEALGAEPLLGRGFAPEDHEAGAGSVVLISHALWRERYGADPAMVGRTIQLDFQPAVVIGVLPSWLEYPDRRDLWAPKRFHPSESLHRGAGWMFAVGRLRAGVTREQAQAELDSVARSIVRDDPRAAASPGILVVPLSEQILGDVRPALYVLLGAVLLLLLVACANVANLILARGTERSAELAVRAALGAGRARLVRQLLAESALLAVVGGAAGLLVAHAALDAILTLAPPELPRLATVALDGRVLAVAGAVTVLTAVLFGLAPAIQLAGARPVRALRGAGRGALGDDRSGARFRSALVVAEMAFSLVLLIGAGLLVRSFLELRANDPGFGTDHRAALQVFLWDRNPTPAARRQRAAAMVERMAALPEVEAVGLVSALPFHPTQIDLRAKLLIDGRPTASDGEEPEVHAVIASPEYFRVMGIPILAGRPFKGRDRDDAPPVAIVNETLARRWFPGEDPVGERVTIGVMSAPLSREIVGVSGDVRPTSLASDPRPEIYVPYAQTSTGNVTFVAKTHGDGADALAALHQALWSVDADQTVYHASTVEGLVADTLAERRFNLLLFATFSGASLLLATLGMYGLVAYATARRVPEIGVRMAMGAGPRDIRRIFLAHGLRLGIPGIVLGAAGSLLATRYLEHMLYGVRPTDPLTFVAWAAVLLVVTLAGAYLPARRAARIDPAHALRRGV